MSETKNYVRFSALLSLIIAGTTLGLSVMVFTKICDVRLHFRAPESQSQMKTGKKDNYVIPYYCVMMCDPDGYYCESRCMRQCQVLQQMYVGSLEQCAYHWMRNLQRSSRDSQAFYDARKATMTKDSESSVQPDAVCDQTCRDIQQALSIATMQLAAVQIIAAIALFIFHEQFSKEYSLLWIGLHVVLILGFIGVVIARVTYRGCFTRRGLGGQEWAWFLMLTIVNAVGLATLVAIMFIVRAFEATLAASGTHVLLPAIIRQRLARRKAPNNVYAVVR